MKPIRHKQPREITALQVRQWLQEWNEVEFSNAAHRRRPESHFYLFTLPAAELKALAGIQRRTTEGRLQRSKDLGIQRRHDEGRSSKIRDFIRYGYPWSDLNEAKRLSGEFTDLLKPGWLPTAIVINILRPDDERRGERVKPEDLIAIDDTSESTTTITLPQHFSGADWEPGGLHPVEVIDGQHRLWAFEDGEPKGDYDLPVVAYYGLDISWQAYLFWSINITPKKITPSLAFDLYPLLRAEDWLERFEGHSVYREARAQELTEHLWAHPESAWHQRINMLGETGLRDRQVTQAAWIRSLMATYVKAWDSRRTSVGGLFGVPQGGKAEVLPWKRAQQAAFLIAVGRKIRDAVKKCREPWAEDLRHGSTVDMFIKEQDPAFVGPHTLLNTDQGIRGLLYVTNDLCYVRATELKLDEWATDTDIGMADESAVSAALQSLQRQPVDRFLHAIAQSLAKFDWRSSSAERLSPADRTAKLVFRGSSGYRELRRQLLAHLAGEPGVVGAAASQALKSLGYS